MKTKVKQEKLSSEKPFFRVENYLEGCSLVFLSNTSKIYNFYESVV